MNRKKGIGLEIVNLNEIKEKRVVIGSCGGGPNPDGPV